MLLLAPVDIANVGQQIDIITVQFSYNIIELFSGHLYSSPVKAIEELVANSYDAFSSKCVVSVPEKIDGNCVWVWDDGESMDLEGLKNLWFIAGSNKREPNEEANSRQRGRLPIGKFGIGKLASYVLGRRITHICRKNAEFLAVTMDYGKFCKGRQYQTIPLVARKLSKEELLSAVPFAARMLKESIKLTFPTIKIPIGHLLWLIHSKTTLSLVD
jgi:hypothetical protein